MPLVRDPKTGHVRYVESAGATMPPRSSGSSGAFRQDNTGRIVPSGAPANIPGGRSAQLEQLPAQPAPSPVGPTLAGLGRSFMRTPGDLAIGGLEGLDALGRGGVGFLKGVRDFIGRPLLAPAAILSEEVPALVNRRAPVSNPFSRYAFSGTEPGTTNRGFAALERGVEAATFLPEMMGAGPLLNRPGLSLLQKGVRSAAIETPFGIGLGGLGALREGIRDPGEIAARAGLGGATAAAVSFGLPLAGRALSRVFGPLIPELSRGGSAAAREATEQGAESLLPRAGREGAEAAAESAPTKVISEAVQETLPGLGTGAGAAARRGMAYQQSTARALAGQADDVAQAALPAASTPAASSAGRVLIPDDVSAPIIARRGGEAAVILEEIAAGNPAVFRRGQAVTDIFDDLTAASPQLAARAQATLGSAVVRRNVASQGAAAAAGTPQGIVARFQNVLAEGKRKLVDLTANIEDVLTKHERDTNSVIIPQRDVRMQFDRIFRSPQIAGQFIEDTGLPQIIAEAEKKGAFDQLSQLLIARRNEELRAINPVLELGRSAAEDRAIIAAFEPTLGVLADRVNAASRKILDRAVEGGLVSATGAQELKTAFPRYIPLNRVFSVIEEQGTYRGGRGALASIAKQTVVLPMKGSKRPVQEVFQSIVEKGHDVVSQSERNKAAQMFADYRHLPGNPFGIIPLRTAEKVKERMSIWKALKESKVVKRIVEGLLRSSKREMRDLMVEIRRLNVKGVKLALGREARPAPATKKSGLVDIAALMRPADRKALEQSLKGMRARAADLRAMLASLNAEGYMRALARERVKLPPRSVSGRVDASLGKAVNEPLLNRVVAKIENLNPKLGRELAGIADAEARLTAVKDAIRRTTKEEAEGLAAAERRLAGQKLNREDKFAELPATLTDDEAKQFIDSMIKLPSWQVESIKAQIARRQPKLSAVLGKIEALGNEIDTMSAASSALYSRGMSLKDAPVPSGMATFNVLRDGITERYAIPHEFAKTIAMATPTQLGLIGQIMALPVRIAKVGITGGLNPLFAAWNFIKDQGSRLFNSRAATFTGMNPVVFGKALFNALGKGELYKEAARNGAITTSFALFRNEAARSVSHMRGSAGGVSRVAHFIRNPKELIKLPLTILEDVVSRGEMVTRLQEYEGTKQAMLNKGASKETAHLIGTDAANWVTANFYRRGEWGTALNSVFLYLNAGIQGNRATIRAFRENPAGTTAKMVTFVLMPLAAVTAWNLKDPARKAAYDDIPEWEKENNLIILPEVPTKDENGRWKAIKVPVQQNIGAMMLPVRRLFEDAHATDPTSFGDMARRLLTNTVEGAFGATVPLNLDFSGREEFISSAASTATPQAIKPTLEIFTNKNFFTGAPIVPGRMEELTPEMQYKDNTSAAAILLARQLNSSPLKIEHFIKGTFGTGSMFILNAIDRALESSGTLARLGLSGHVGGESLSSNALRRAGRATGGANEGQLFERAQELRTEGRSATFQKKQKVEDVASQLAGLSRVKRNDTLRRLRREDPSMAKAVTKELADIDRGFTTQDNVIKSLGVEDGTRARMILELEEGMSRSEVEDFERDLMRKKILTPAVRKQIQESKRRGVRLPPR